MCVVIRLRVNNPRSEICSAQDAAMKMRWTGKLLNILVSPRSRFLISVTSLNISVELAFSGHSESCVHLSMLDCKQILSELRTSATETY